MQLLLRVSVFTSLLVLSYVLNLMAFFRPVHRHATSNGLLRVARGSSDIPNITAMFSGVCVLTVVVNSSDETRLLRLVRMLDTAVYDVCQVDLVVVTTGMNVSRRFDWGHGELRITSGFDAVGNASLVVVLLEDAMEVSPFFALWFLLQRTPGVTAGGGCPSHPAGLAVDSQLWNQVVDRGLPLVCNNCTTASFPALSDGRVFVRHEFQPPARAERSPKLVRSWDLSRSQWGLF